METPQRLSGKIALVTGSGRGIGRGLALAFAREGADVCINDRWIDRAESVAAEIRAMGRRSLAVQADVTRPEEVVALAQKVRDAFGKLHILVNNAGGGGERRSVVESEPEAWLKVFHDNTITVYLVSHHLLPLIVESGGGHVINIGSGLGHRADAGSSCYRGSKAAAWMLTQCMAMEVWDKGVQVNELIPGPVQVADPRPGWTAGLAPGGMPSEYVKLPDDVAPLALWLVTQGEHGPTGQSFSLARRVI